MAADDKDIGQEAFHPRNLPTLIGHEAQQLQLARAFASGKLHHAWMITGPRGIGKATLAYRMAAHVLQGRASATSLDVDEHSAAARWIASQSHPDLFVLERAYDAKAKRLKTEISVDDARQLLDFFSKTSGSSEWRVAIIDPADDLNIASSNALLKMIEEPPPRALLLLVCNHPGRLLRTIRSRCLKLDLSPLTSAEMDSVMQYLAPDVVQAGGEAYEHALQLAAGSPGLLLDLLESEGAKAFVALRNGGILSPQLIIEAGNRMAQRNASAEDFSIFCDLLLSWVSSLARQHALAGTGQKLAETFAAIEHSIHQANALNLDRRQTVMGALTLVDKALHAG